MKQTNCAIILGIETSCDDTGVAIYHQHHGLLANGLYSQIAEHAPHGGVVPEIASRNHCAKLMPLLQQVLAKANLTMPQISAIACTVGPGLPGALLVGSTFAASLAALWHKPLLPIHHLEGHMLSVFVDQPQPNPWPLVMLLVSGGHTCLVASKRLGDYRMLGETLDDAAGEAFDKTAKRMGLPYPGGARLSALAQQGNAGQFALTAPMVNRPGLDFSFSGLKTQVGKAWQLCDQQPQTKANLAACFEQTVIRTLTIKAQRALALTGYKQLLLAGGVSANLPLREQLLVAVQAKGAKLIMPKRQWCTDNGAMIAYAGMMQWLHRYRQQSQLIKQNHDIMPRWALSEANYSLLT